MGLEEGVRRVEVWSGVNLRGVLWPQDNSQSPSCVSIASPDFKGAGTVSPWKNRLRVLPGEQLGSLERGGEWKPYSCTAPTEVQDYTVTRLGRVSGCHGNCDPTAALPGGWARAPIPQHPGNMPTSASQCRPAEPASLSRSLKMPSQQQPTLRGGVGGTGCQVYTQ